MGTIKFKVALDNFFKSVHKMVYWPSQQRNEDAVILTAVSHHDFSLTIEQKCFFIKCTIWKWMSQAWPFRNIPRIQH